ncbi:MAG: diguanylate cyclase [Deltaproteobacteria bacterium]|nr:diguanylate cyclase [Deltaproteobacteria bacterium]
MSSSLKEIRMKLEALEREIHLLRPIFEAIRDPFFILNQKGEFLKVNPKGLELLIYPPEELQRMVFIDVVALNDLSAIREGFDEMNKGREISLNLRVVNRLREEIPVDCFGALRGETYLITLRDLRERLQLEEEWERSKKQFMEKIRERDQYARELQAMRDLFKERTREVERMKEEAVLLSYTDDLTGIYNHRFFIQQLTLEVERQKRYSTPLSLLMIDIDYFKHYNDHNGHLAGDEALKAIALLIQHGVRQSDIIARYGGEEFAAILVNATREKAMEIAERVRRIIAETPFPNEKEQPNGDVTVSVGVATFSSPISTLTDLIRKADNALYRAKRAGRNRIEG